MTTAIVWFRRDLRVHDHPALTAAHRSADLIVPVFVLDPRLLDLRSETARLRLLTRLFRGAIKRLDFVERAQARARSNGKVHFGE